MKELIADPRAAFRGWVGVSGFILLFCVLVLGIMVGAVQVSPGEIWDTLFSVPNAETYQIIQNIRIPRVLVGGLVGINLALAGCILQGVLRNPLADPGIIGISAGAGLAAMLIMILWPALTGWVPVAAFIGALLAAGMVFSLSWDKGIHPLRLILAGVAVAAFFGGGMSALMVFYSDQVQGTVNWMTGGLQGRSWGHVKMILPYTLAGLVSILWATRYLNLLQLGDDAAKGLGVPVEMIRTLLICLAAFLAASAVSVAGLLGFVGLIVPHITRMLVGSDFEYLLPCSALFGAILVVAADIVARTAFRPVEIPVGIFMAFLGAPFFLYLLKRRMYK